VADISCLAASAVRPTKTLFLDFTLRWQGLPRKPIIHTQEAGHLASDWWLLNGVARPRVVAHRMNAVGKFPVRLLLADLGPSGWDRCNREFKWQTTHA